jgi:hypothetical protein
MTNTEKHLVALSRNFTGPFHAQKSGIGGIVCVKDANGKTVTTTGTYPSAQRKAAVMNGASK